MSKGIVRLQGKDYKTVALRMSEFRERFSISDGWAVLSTIHTITDSAVLFRAEIVDPAGRVVGVGHASGATRGSKALEKCETTAIGRALAAIGLTGEEYASADEIAAWVEDRESPTPPPKVAAPKAEEAPYRWPDKDRAWFCARLGEMGLAYADVAAWSEIAGWGRPSGWSRKKLGALLDRLADPASDTRGKLDTYLNSGE